MEEKIVKKVSRLLELSIKFSKDEYDIVPAKEKEVVGRVICNSLVENASYVVPNNFYLDGRELYIDKDGSIKAKDEKTVTRVDTIRAQADIEAKLLEEYFEYEKLQNELSKYFSALTEINK